VKTLLDVLEEQAGGFYDPRTKSFYLLDDMPKSMTALLAAHEMTHALDDQRFDIDGRLEKVADDDDASFALSAVAEGSATIASAVYVAQVAASGRLDPEGLAAAGEMELIQTERLNAMPPALRRQLLGPYVLGMSFLLRGQLDTLAGGFRRRSTPRGAGRRSSNRFSIREVLDPSSATNRSRSRSRPGQAARGGLGRQARRLGELTSASWSARLPRRQRPGAPQRLDETPRRPAGAIATSCGRRGGRDRALATVWDTDRTRRNSRKRSRRTAPSSPRSDAGAKSASWRGTPVRSARRSWRSW
jgi:hypothetical protein